MAYQAIFKRWEIKYMLTQEQKQRLLQAMAPYMLPDRYGRTTIRNIYFDTDHYRLIRRSLEKPVYKEKLRIRSYRQTDPEEPVFVELKKKYKGVVYKRRISLPQNRAISWLTAGAACPEDTQITREIQYFCDYYGPLAPKVFLSYDREAYFGAQDRELRITFDENIRFRLDALSLSADTDGTSLLEPGQALMEIKTAGSIPLWLTALLTRERLFKTSFSKYGTAYLHHILKGNHSHV